MRAKHLVMAALLALTGCGTGLQGKGAGEVMSGTGTPSDDWPSDGTLLQNALNGTAPDQGAVGSAGDSASTGPLSGLGRVVGSIFNSSDSAEGEDGGLSLSKALGLGSSSTTATSGAPVPSVQNARLDHTPNGAILRADAVMPSTGYYNALLRPVNDGRPDDNGRIFYDFVATAPGTSAAVASEFARTISAAVWLPYHRIEGAQSITVTGAGNDVTVRLK